VTDEQRLDLDLYRSLVSVQRYSIHHVNQTLRKIERHFDRWSVHDGGLLVLSPGDRRRRNEEFLAWVEEERAAEQASADGQAARNGRPGLTGQLLKVVGRLRRRG